MRLAKGGLETYAALFCAFLLLCAGVMESFSSLLLRFLFKKSSPGGSEAMFGPTMPLLVLILGSDTEGLCSFCWESEGDIDGAGLCCNDCL